MTVGSKDNWGRWGADDEAGAANLLQPDAVLSALTVPTRGRVFPLAQLLARSGQPRLHGFDDVVTAPIHTWTATGVEQPDDDPEATYFANDFVGGSVHGSTTHIDALGHAFSGGKLYNGFDASTSSASGMARCGIDKAPPIVSRGVLLDVAAAKEVEALPGDYAIDAADIELTLERQGVDIGPGDAVLIRTGIHSLFARDDPAYSELQGGLGVDGARLLVDRDVVLVGADNNSVETSGSELPVHRMLLFEHGIYLLEFMYLEQLAEAEIYEFLFVAAPLRIAGGSGSPINPIAIA